MDNSEVVLKIILRYQNVDYECEGYAWEEEGYYRSGYEHEGVRDCEHDYASLLPKEVTQGKDFGCEQKEIEVLDYWFFDKLNNKKIDG